MAPRVPSVSTASASLSFKNSRGSVVQQQQQQQQHGAGGGRNKHQKYPQNNTLPPPPPKNSPTHIPLTSNNKIPSQILNVVSSSADPSMTFIELDNKSIGDSEVSKLAHALITNSTVQILSLRNCHITDKGVQAIAECLQRNGTIAALYLDSNRISREGCATLSTALINNETLSVLTLNCNHEMGDRGAVYLMNALEHNSTLLTLEVDDCGVHENRLSQIESILEDRQLDSNFESLLERLRDDDFRVTGIDLTGRRIGDKGVTRLAEALSDNTQVRQIWLRACQIGDAGAKALASCLEQNMAIVDLYLAKNGIGDEGLSAIADALGLSNLTLVTLELDDNRVGDKGINALTVAMERNTSVLEATFENNALLRHSSKLQKLQTMLQERRNGLNMVSFVVDPDDASAASGAEKDKKGIVDMSICSSYMPSCYRKAGFSSQADSKTGAKKGHAAAPKGRPPPPTPKRKRESSRIVSSSHQQDTPGTGGAVAAAELAVANIDHSKTSSDPPEGNVVAMVPIAERSYDRTHSSGTTSSSKSKKSGRKTALVPVQEQGKSSNDSVELAQKPPESSSTDLETQRNFDDTIKQLFRRVETMMRINHFASIHYRARHYWMWFVPISSCIFVAGILSLANAFNIAASVRLGLGLCTCLLALLAFVLNLLQTRFGWSSRAEIHRSVQLELSQVSFRLESLRMYMNGKLLSASLSPESRAHAIRDLYRIDVYLRAIQQCTPDAPEPISEAFHLMGSRIKLMCMRYPHAVKHRCAEYGNESADMSSPVPVDMHIDALDLLGSEIEDYSLYPIFLPDPSRIVSRSIDVFFSPRSSQNAAPTHVNSRHDDDDGYDEEAVDCESVYSDEGSY
ncbi:hypothetical protein ACHAWC_011830 [Mediolabrus comicus]